MRKRYNIIKILFIVIAIFLYAFIKSSNEPNKSDGADINITKDQDNLDELKSVIKRRSIKRPAND